MANSYPEIKTFRGLYLQKNSFTVPDGAMERAMNCIISQDNRISKTPGYYDYFAPVSETLNNLFYYQGRLLAVYDTKLAYFTTTGAYPNEVGAETEVTGASVSITSPKVSRSAQANSNLYFTTDDGVLKLDSYNGKIFKAGVPPALDISATLLPDNGWFEPNSQVAVRIVFGRRDANGNLILGAPSEQLVLTNPPVTAPYTVSGSGPTYTVTVTSPNHGLVTGMDITVASSTGTPAIPAIPANFAVTVTGDNTFTFTIGASAGSGNISYGASRSVRYEFSVPTEIDNVSDGYFYQIYRTTVSLSADATPTPNYRLVEEKKLTAAEIAADAVFYTDDIDEVLVQFAPELYTNPNSREGELQSNLRPPKCDDVSVFKNCVIYGGVTTRHLMSLELVDPTALSDGSFIEIKIGASTRRYVARKGVGNTNTSASGVALSYGFPDLTIASPGHGFDVGDTVLIANAEGTGTLPKGEYVITAATSSIFTVTAPGITTITALEFQGVKDSAGHAIFTLDNDDLSVATQLRVTARALVKAVNRDDDSGIYASYVSSIQDVPGKIGLQAKGFGPPIYLRSDSLASGEAFLPALPDSFSSGPQVYSQNDSKPNVLFSSKIGEPEAVPLVNDRVAGSQNAVFYRSIALRDSVIILKSDGVFRLTGDNPQNFTVSTIDNTIFCVSGNSVALLNNQVYFLSNQGVCVVDESRASILSRETVEDVIMPIVGKPGIDVETGAVGYESDRTYRLSTLGPNSSTKSDSYIYNFINNSWTQFDVLFKQGIVADGGSLFLISSDNKIKRERKTQTRIDYCGQNHDVTVVSVTADGLSAVIYSPTSLAEEGDVIVKNDAFLRIKRSSSLGGDLYDVTFRSLASLSPDDEVILYKAYETSITFAPFHAGQVGLMKQFSQLQIHTRTPNVTQLTINFSGYVYGGSETTVWQATNVQDLGAMGWGLFPWGFVPWGQADGTNIERETKPATPIRIYIPLFQQRNTYLKTILTHREAGESLDIQALSYTVRAYKERVSK